MKRDILAISCILFGLSLILSGCTSYVPADIPVQDTPQETIEQTADEPAVDIPETPTEKIPSQEETAPQEEPAPAIVPTSVKIPSKYTPAVSTPAEAPAEEHDNCGCSYSWDPVCDRDGKTHMNLCLFKCFGNTEADLLTNVQCPMKSPAIYVVDTEREFGPDRWNGGYCWRDMYDSLSKRTGDIRRCDNIIVNGQFYYEPTPAEGNWLDQSHLMMDWKGEKNEYTLFLTKGQTAVNSEYNESFMPLFEKGRYRLSFQARQDSNALNDWKVKLTLQDWWSKTSAPDGLDNCYTFAETLDAQEIYIDMLPHKWKRYNFEFDLPIDETAWQEYTKVTPGCAYAWNGMPNGYKIEVTGPSLGTAYFDDFALERIE